MNPGEMTWENTLDNPWTSNVIYVHKTDHYGNDMSPWLLSMEQGDLIYIRNYEGFEEFSHYTCDGVLLYLQATLI